MTRSSRNALSQFWSPDWQKLFAHESSNHEILTEVKGESNTLVIAYNFPPFADASSITVAKRILDLGVNVDVVSQNLSSIRNIDNQLFSIVEEKIENHYLIDGKPVFASLNGIELFVEKAMEALWTNLKKSKYKIIYSRSMFPASHFLAANIKRLFPQVHWIAEFSDPISHTVEGTQRLGGRFQLAEWPLFLAEQCSTVVQTYLKSNPDVFEWCELLTLDLADELWFTNSNQMSVMIDSIPALGTIRDNIYRKSLSKNHPTLPEQFYKLGNPYYKKTRERYRIGYFGEFYPNRGLADLFNSFLLLPHEVRNGIEIHVFTNSGESCRASSAEIGLSSFVYIHDQLSFLDFCSTAMQTDLLVVSDVIPGDSYDVNPYLPSKVSDYLGTNGDVLAYVWPGSPLSRHEGVNKVLIGDSYGGMRTISHLFQSRSCQGVNS